MSDITYNVSSFQKLVKEPILIERSSQKSVISCKVQNDVDQQKYITSTCSFVVVVVVFFLGGGGVGGGCSHVKGQNCLSNNFNLSP